MARKRLTKTQVRKAYRDIGNRISKLMEDKVYHDNSLVPKSVPKIMEMHNTIFRITKKL